MYLTVQTLAWIVSYGWLVLPGVYLLFVYLKRHKRARSLEKEYAPAGRASFSSLTTNQAQAILKDLTELEFPKVFGYSIVFALFKTYGIPSVSSLLVSTGQLASLETASKRIADTGVILLDFCLNAPTSERTLKAISRMNYLHAPYLKSGKITNDDLLYTLSLFALEPSRWVKKHEWRCLTELELAACGTFWKSMGDAMGINFSCLTSHGSGWKDGLHWLNEVEEWSLQYEAMYMVPAETNQKLANSHFEILCINVPKQYHTMCKQIFSVLLGPRLQKAMIYPDAPLTYICVVNVLSTARWLVVRFFLPPRSKRKQYIPEHADPRTGRYNALEYLSYPWYVRPSLNNRWGPRAWFTWSIGRKLPGDDGNRYAPEGWTHAELGPKYLRGKGIKSMEKDQQRLLAQDRGGCPFRTG